MFCPVGNAVDYKRFKRLSITRIILNVPCVSTLRLISSNWCKLACNSSTTVGLESSVSVSQSRIVLESSLILLEATSSAVESKDYEVHSS